MLAHYHLPLKGRQRRRRKIKRKIIIIIRETTWKWERKLRGKKFWNHSMVNDKA
jgi:hypothetical protein